MKVDLDLGLTRDIIFECRSRGVLRNQLAYILATAYWESARRMAPVREALGGSDKQSIDRLQHAYDNGKLPWVSKPYWDDGYFGRGLVQITHKSNYEKAGSAIGVDLVGNPQLALDDNIAIDILISGMIDGWFTGHKVGDYITLTKSDFVGARRVVNGIDKAKVIADIAQDYDVALVGIGYGVGVKPERSNVMQTKTAKGGAAVLSGVAVQQAGENITAIAADVPGGVGQSLAVVGSLIIVGAALFIIFNRLRDMINGDR